jgi:hypothetical protein
MVIEQTGEPPEVCPQCANTQIVRVLWSGIHLSSQDKNDIEGGRAILASHQIVSGNTAWLENPRVSTRRLPEWVCLTCEPKWLEVNRLALQDYEWQLAKEEAVANHKFDIAKSLLQQQEELRSRLIVLIMKLLDHAGPKGTDAGPVE